MVANGQFPPVMKQLESYQANRQQNGLPEIKLKIDTTCTNEYLSRINAEVTKALIIEKNLLTGE